MTALTVPAEEVCSVYLGVISSAWLRDVANKVTGAGNIGDIGSKSTQRRDRDVVPDSAVRPSTDAQDYHTGRGGAGNEHSSHKKTEPKQESSATGAAPVSLADKLKDKLMGALKK